MKKTYSLLAIGAICCASTPLLAQTELNTQPQPQPATPASAQTYTERNIPPAAPAMQSGTARYRSNLNMELGWNGPYGGLGFSYAYALSDAVDLGGGVGLGVGGKIGVGGRYYLRPDRDFTPYLGLNLTRSGRIDEATLDLDGEYVEYSLKPSGLVNLRGGFRWQPGRVGLLGTLGYAVRLTGDPVVYLNGYSPTQRAQDVIQIVAPGGLEISAGITIGIN